MRNFNNANNNTCQSGYSAHLESSVVSSSGDDAKNTMKRKSKFLSFTKICTFSLVLLMSKCYESGNSNNSVSTFNDLNNGAGLRSLRMLACGEWKEDQFESTYVENEHEENTEENEETENCSGNNNCKDSSPCCNAVDKTCQTNCGACTCGFKTLDLYFEKKLLDILDAGNKKAGSVMHVGAHVLSGLKDYLKYVLLFSPLLLEFLASKLLLSGYYKSSQFVSSVCVTFYLYVFYKIIENGALERAGFISYDNTPREIGLRSVGSSCEASCGKNTCPDSNCESSCKKKNGCCSKKEDSKCKDTKSKSRSA
ncbi:hypothetical protein AK88_05570 [Plasmodium fragile]|uniref:Uncharacterized protein n=1 Tax=Plasmodium fragile TaxID=5857 RepID=A0A0D9QCR2_PLAFR|nr:uncharacterized protein AK88_05570 [Plasmodium fragile]KJP84798.1 hypothetical protein AK88_05570 [Plasmodium fragile]